VGVDDRGVTSPIDLKQRTADAQPFVGVGSREQADDRGELLGRQIVLGGDCAGRNHQQLN